MEDSICFESIIEMTLRFHHWSMGVGVRVVNNILSFHGLLLKLVTYPK